MFDLLEPGDTVVADHGFDIENILQGSTGLSIPPLLGPRQFGDDELVETRRITSLHVHVEQAMKRIKNSPNTHYFVGSLCSMAELSLHVHYDCLHFLTSMV